SRVHMVKNLFRPPRFRGAAGGGIPARLLSQPIGRKGRTGKYALCSVGGRSVTGLSCDRGATKNLPVRDQRKWAPSGAHSPWLRAGPERAAASSPQTVSAFTRALRRLTLRAATLAWTMPLPAARLISGSAALSAVEAA